MPESQLTLHIEAAHEELSIVGQVEHLSYEKERLIQENCSRNVLSKECVGTIATFDINDFAEGEG